MPRCLRSWEVEALRDGRLSGDARASAEAHVVQCPTCSREKRAFDDLSLTLKAATSPDDQLALRRLRHRVLARVQQGTATEKLSTTRRPAFLATALVFATLAMGSALWLTRPSAEPPAEAAHVADDRPTGVDASADAVWTRAWEDDGRVSIERIRIESGDLHLSNPRKPSARPLVVTVPDGNIEDLGTVFRVVVRHGQTTQIAVTEGRVRFNRALGEPILIEAGGTWEAPPLAVSSTSRDDRAAVSDAPAASATVLPKPPLAAPRPAPSSSPNQRSSADAEDTAYLHVLALAREGRHDEARLAAAAYLARFPNGFRRIEVQQIEASMTDREPSK